MRNDYLDDTAFLKYFNELEFKEQYVRINSLDYETERRKVGVHRMGA